MKGSTTLGEFIIRRQADFPHASGELSSLLSSIELAAKIVNREINQAGLSDILGTMGQANIQGEEQQNVITSYSIHYTKLYDILPVSTPIEPVIVPGSATMWLADMAIQ